MPKKLNQPVYFDIPIKVKLKILRILKIVKSQKKLSTHETNLPVSYEFLFFKVEESGEGFDPPTEIRTIFVPIENAINIPETFDINLGTSFGYNRYVGCVDDEILHLEGCKSEL